MKIKNTLKNLIKVLLDNMHERRKVILALSCLVVFVTTYTLILPAFTLDKEEAAEQGGIDVPAVAEVQDEEKAEPAEEVKTEEKAETQEKQKTETAPKKEKTETAKKETDDPLKYEGTDYNVAVTDKNKELSASTRVEVNEISADDKKQAKQYKELYADALKTVREEDGQFKVADFKFAKFYDISLVDGQGAVEPDKGVAVTISYEKALQKELKVADPDKVRIIHFAEDKKTGEITPAVLDSKDVDVTVDKKQMKETSFEAEGFSVYAVVYTVDFEYDVDGAKYEYSMEGGTTIDLADVLTSLKVVTDDKNTDLDEVKAFIQDIKAVKFSDPELVEVVKNVKEEKTEGFTSEGTTDEEKTIEVTTWALKSLKAFDTNETLTITMKNGDQFAVKVTDAQLKKKVISASGETYEVTVTYDDTTGIPADAELKVREIEKTEDEFTKNVEATNRELQAQDAPEVVNPVQFDISIVAGGEEIEPKEGSIVNVKIRLAPEVFSGKTEDEEVSEEGDNSENEETGEIWFNGSRIEENGEGVATYTVSHISDDGTVDIIENVESSVNEDEKVVLQFETESFSDYLMGNPNGPGGLPSTIYVGDEIYMWERADYWVTEINNVVTETKHKPNGNNDGSNWKTVTAIRPGKFRIYNRYNEWGDYKEITVLPAREDTTLPGTIDTVDNASIGLNLNLFDYDLDGYLDDYFNNFNHSNNPVSYDFLNHGINNGHPLKFWGSGIGNNYGSANQYQEHGVTSIVQRNLVGGVGGYPQITANSNPDHSTESLAYLFTPSNGTDKEAYTNVNHLFKREGDYYVYDSNSNYAYYDKNQGSGGNFVVYDRTYKQKSGSDSGSIQDKAIGFFPFHKWNEDYDLYVNWNKNLNHHFGMSMSVPFSLPKDPKAVKDSTGQPIIFEFSGDDDLWVFIDGKLAMDIGGIHQPTSGTINFQTGEVTVNGSTQLTKNQFNSRFPDLYDGKKHTMQVFYIERGGCDSNCKIKFNMTQYGNVEFDKVDEDDQSILLSGAVFGLYKDDKCTQPLMEELKDGSRRPFIVETDENGHAKLEDVPLGDYYLKEIHAPDGYPIAVGSDTVRVRVYLDASGNVKTSVGGQETDVKITNKKPANINLGLKKEWQDADGQAITAPDGVNATFEIKRNRTYETYTEREVQGQDVAASKLIVGWLHNNEPHIYEEFDLVAGSQATVSWSLTDGYEGKIGCILDGQEHTKSSNPNNIYSHGFTMPAAGGTTILYIIDESDHGNAIKNINVAGSQFYGNSGGGFIHEFKTVTEPDPDFTYTGTSVTDNKVTLPVNESTWEYMFSELPALGTGMVTVDGKQQKVTYKYSYYIEEVSSTAPEGTVVIYKDLKGNVINSPTDAETHTSGTETVINKVPYGYLQIKKEVTYNGSSENLTAAQKSKLAGEYKFKIYKKEQCAAEDAVQDPNAAEDAEDKDLIVTITIGTDGQAVVGPNTPVRLLAGNYWIKEVESSNPAMFPVNNPIAVAVTKDHTSDSPVIKSLTNNYDENNGPDKISIDIEKKFSGLDNAAQVPQNFEVLLQYTLSGQTKTVTLKNTELATGANGEKITWSQSADGFTWHWKVTSIPSEAKNFKIKEQNYDNAKGYDWKSATLNGSNITSTVDELHDLTVTAPAAELTDVTKDRRTSDSGQNTMFYLEDDDILLSKLTANQGTLVISKHPLNLAERDAVVKGWPQQGGFKTPPHYFSIDEHPNGFSYGDKTIKFGEKNGRTIVKFTQNASAQETVFAVTYNSEEARNNANLVNTYEEVPVTIDIVKVDENDNTKKLPGAIFTLRQLKDAEPSPSGTIDTMDGTTPRDSAPTDAKGKTSFGDLTHGYYEVTEKQAPAGYVKTEDIVFYFKVENGEVTWLEKGTGKPSTWEKKTGTDNGKITFAAATVAVAADPDKGVEAQAGTNATFTVPNEPGAALPHTGGIGTTIFYIFGAVLTLGSAVILISRMRIQNNSKKS